MNTEKRGSLYPGLTHETAVMDARTYFAGRRNENHGSFPSDAVTLQKQKRALYEHLVAIPDGTWAANSTSVAIYTHGQPEELLDTLLVVVVDPKEALFIDRAGKLGTYSEGERRIFEDEVEANQLTGLENRLAQVFNTGSVLAHITDDSEAIYHP